MDQLARLYGRHLALEHQSIRWRLAALMLDGWWGSDEPGFDPLLYGRMWSIGSMAKFALYVSKPDDTPGYDFTNDLYEPQRVSHFLYICIRRMVRSETSQLADCFLNSGTV